MTRINTNVSSLFAQNTLNRSNTDLQTALTRLSTGLRINSGRDDPAGLIASETLRSDIGAVRSAITNTERANQVISTADSALGQVSSLLNDIRGLVTEAANQGGVSPEQIKANQTQIDSSLDALNRISQTTSFQGRRLLDGNLDFVSAFTGGTGGNVSDLVINQANLGAAGTLSVNVAVTTAATKATNATTAGVPLTDSLVFQLSGASGSEVFTFQSGATAANITDAVNLVSDSTGVSATINGGNVQFDSTAFGSSAFVDIEVISQGSAGTFALSSASRKFGTDVVATVNGTTANGDGNTLSISTATLDTQLTLTAGSTADVAFDITGGGALFQLGPDVVTNQQARIGIQSVNTATLGGVSGRLFELRSGESGALDTDTRKAENIVNEVITKVTKLRGRLGAFQKATLDSNVATLNDTLVNLTAAESQIRNADFAAETANLTRAQILVQSGTKVLSIANSNPQNVLSLLR